MLNKQALQKKIEEEQKRKGGINKEALLAKIKAEQPTKLEEPEISRSGLWESIQHNFIAPRTKTMSPGYQGLLQGAVKQIGVKYGEFVEPVTEGLQKQMQMDDPITISKSANNLVQGGAIAAVDMPRFITNAIADPAGTLIGMGDMIRDVSDKSIGALAYVAINYVTDPIGVLEIPEDQLNVLKKDFEDIAREPANPLMVFMIMAGMVEGAGKLAGVKPTKLLTAKERLDPANLKVAQPKVIVEGQKPITVVDMASRLKQIDQDVLSFWTEDKPLPKNYSEGTLRRSAERLYNVDADALVAKAQRNGDLSKSGIKMQDEIAMQHAETMTSEATAINEVLDIQKKQREAYNKASGKTWQDRKDLLQRNVVDAAGTTKRVLATFGAAGAEAIRYHDLARGASSEAARQFDIQSKDVFGNIKSGEVDDLGLYLQGERTIEIDTKINPERIKLGEPAIQHPYGKGKETWKPFVDNIDRIYGVDKSNRIRAAAEEFHVAMRDNLDALKAEGLLDAESYKALARYAKYEPRKFLQHQAFDPVIQGRWQGQARSVNSSGIRSLEEGSIEPIINNPKLLLWEVTSRTQGRIFNNRAAQSLLKVAEENPKSDVIRLAGEGNVPAGYTQVSAVRDGKRYDMWMQDNLAAEWLLLPPEIKPATANVLRWISGQKILKPMATGINPEFIVANLPRDIGHIYMTTHEYSNWSPIFTGQILKDIAVVLPDAMMRKGRYIDYIKEGGGMEFLTGQGDVFAKTPNAEGMMIGLRKVQEGLSYLNNTSEIITRLALRERAIKNGKTGFEATWIARNYMDFAQGGLLSKSVDTIFPYFNAGIVGTRGLTRAAISNPANFAFKVANLGAFAIGLWHLNNLAYPDLVDGISDITKNNNWIFGLPWTKKERGVTKRYYLKIPKDQGQRLFASGFDAMCDFTYKGKFPLRQVVRGFGDAMPIMPDTFFPPAGETLLALLGNYDGWKLEKIYQGEYRFPEDEYDPAKTSPLAIKAGQTTAKIMGKARLEEGLTGFASPMRLETAQQKLFTYYNVYRDGLAWAGKYFLDDLPEDQREMMTQDMFKRVPGLRRLLSLNNPESNKYEESTAFTREENSRIFQQDLKVEDFADGGDSDGYSRWRDTQPREDRERLESKWKREWTDRKRLVDQFPKFWLSAARKSPRVRAYSLYTEWSKLDDDKKKQELLDMVWQIPGFKSELTYKHFKNFQREGSK